MRFTPSRWLATVDPRASDATLAVALAAASCVIGGAYHPMGWPEYDLRAYVLTCLINLPLAARRRHPVVVALAGNAAFATYLHLGYQPSLNFWGPVIALVFVAAGRRRPTVLAIAALTTATIWYSGAAAHLPAVVAAAQALIIPPVAVGVGSAARRLALRNAQLAALSSQLQEQQRERAQQAVMEERVRIARELHDVIAHHMSLISIQAGLASYVLRSDPATADTALTTIADTSREALAEMRRMLDLLRWGPDDMATCTEATADGADDPAPGLDRLDALIDRVRAAGLTVEVELDGEPLPLPPGAALCVYRVVQEGLTNVLTHAGPATATVSLSYRAGIVCVQVIDDGRGGAVSADTTADGRIRHGLSGMRERARLYGGVFVAGPRPEGGFAVRLDLPAPKRNPAAAKPTR